MREPAHERLVKDAAQCMTQLRHLCLDHRTYREWSGLLPSLYSRLQSLELSSLLSCHHLHWTALTQLRSLCVDQTTEFCHDGDNALLPLQHLTSLGVHKDVMDFTGVVLVQLTALRHLDLSANGIVEDLPVHALASRLHSLVLDRDSLVTDVTPMTALTSLQLDYADKVRGVGSLTGLRRLDLRGSMNRHFALTDLTGLCELSLNRCRTVHVLDTLVNLTSLDLSYYEAAVQLQHLTALTVLNLSGCRRMRCTTTDATLHHQQQIAFLTGLTRLNLSGNETVGNIQHLTQLRELDVSGSPHFARTLPSLPLLTRLNISAQPFLSLTSLQRLPALQRVRRYDVDRFDHFSNAYLQYPNVVFEMIQ
jgi:Leucine-rich repeat (LRR) protein